MKDLDFLDPQHLMHSIVSVFDHFKDAERKPGAEKWTTQSASRQVMVAMVSIKWMIMTGNKSELFPYSEDFVVSMWLKFRKEGDKSGFRAELTGQLF